jgi:hypothetical protein
MLLIGYTGKEAGGEELDVKKAQDAKDEEKKKTKKYRLASVAIVAYIHKLSGIIYTSMG